MIGEAIICRNGRRAEPVEPAWLLTIPEVDSGKADTSPRQPMERRSAADTTEAIRLTIPGYRRHRGDVLQASRPKRRLFCPDIADHLGVSGFRGRSPAAFAIVFRARSGRRRAWRARSSFHMQQMSWCAYRYKYSGGRWGISSMPHHFPAWWWSDHQMIITRGIIVCRREVSSWLPTTMICQCDRLLSTCSDFRGTNSLECATQKNIFPE